MGLFEDIDSLIEEVTEAKDVPFSASAMVNKQDLLEVLERMRKEVPQEMKQAQGMMKDRKEMLERTKRETEKVVQEAREERDRLVARTEIVAAANTEADKIISEAKRRATEIRSEAEDYVDAKLANFEVVLQKTLAAVAKGRRSLRGRQEEVLPDEAEEPDKETKS